ncbi:MAG TPA: DUF3347 domain-containing protein [Acidobacteria bacterium]|nr:DUF3347 domain-containing protein [Acidobacteriota bacterium]
MKRLTVLTAALMLLLTTTASAHWSNAFVTVLKDYDRVRLALARNSLDDVAKYAHRMETELVHLNTNITALHAGVARGDAVEVHKELPAMIEAVKRLQETHSLAEARKAFLELSRGMARWHALVIKKKKAIVVTCSGTGEVWLQAKKYRKEILNPYEPGKTTGCAPVIENQ